MAKALLGQWEDAAKDLHLASKLDFDEEIDAVLKKVTPMLLKVVLVVYKKPYFNDIYLDKTAGRTKCSKN